MRTLKNCQDALTSLTVSGKNRAPHQITLNPLIQPELYLVRSHNRNFLGQGLSNNLPVKRVAMMRRQVE